MRRLIGVVLAVFAIGHAASAADLSHLRAQAGQYTDVLLADPALTAALHEVLGSDYDSFMEAIGVVFPSTLVDDRYLIAEGCKAHDCGAQGGLVLIDLATGDVMAVRKGTYGYAQTSPAADDYIANWRTQ